MMDQYACCNVNYETDAEFEIDSPDEFGTYMCKDHVMNLIDYSDVMHTYRIGVKDGD